MVAVLVLRCATFERSAASFDNPDFVDVVIHSYRHRYGVVPGDSAHTEVEARLAEQPEITIPTIVLLGANDGVDPPSVEDKDAVHFKGAYSRHILAGIGHNVPQEAQRYLRTQSEICARSELRDR